MDEKYTEEQLRKASKNQLIEMLLAMQEKAEKLESQVNSMNERMELWRQERYGRKSEKNLVDPDQTVIPYFFDEAETVAEENPNEEAELEEYVLKKVKRKKKVGARDEDLDNLPQEEHDHDVSPEELDAMFGEGNYRELPPDKYRRLKYIPAYWVVENHTVHVYVGTDGLHQDEFVRGDRPKDLLRNSILTPSLMAAIMNAKYVNGMPLYRIEQEFSHDGFAITRQNMGNWVIQCAQRYLSPVYERMRQELLTHPVTQADETPVEVIKDGRAAGSESYMWVHRSGEFDDHQLVLFEYQKTRKSDHPIEFYKDYKGILVTDGLEQYHRLDRILENVTNANCWAHARRFFADAVKAFGKGHEMEAKVSVAHQALIKIGAIYKLEGTLRELSAEDRLRVRQASIKPMVDEYFAWVKTTLEDTSLLLKGKTAQGLYYSLNQEPYLRIFLTNGDVPIDNSASERAIRPFVIGRNNWLFSFSIKGAQASATVYSITESAKMNNLRPYDYLVYLFSSLKDRADENGHIDPGDIDDLLPWSQTLPDNCYKTHRR